MQTQPLGDGSSRIEITHDGLIKIYAKKLEKLMALQHIAQISLNQATNSVGFTLSRRAVINLDTNKPIPLPIYGEGFAAALKIDPVVFEKVATDLLQADTRSLAILARSKRKQLVDVSSIGQNSILIVSLSCTKIFKRLNS